MKNARSAKTTRRRSATLRVVVDRALLNDNQKLREQLRLQQQANDSLLRKVKILEELIENLTVTRRMEIRELRRKARAAAARSRTRK